MNWKFPERNAIGVADLLNAYNIIRKRNFSTQEIQELSLFGYTLGGIILNETVGMPNSPSPVLKRISGDSLFGSDEFKKLKLELDSFNAVQTRFGSEAPNEETLYLNETLTSLNEKLDLLSKHQ